MRTKKPRCPAEAVLTLVAGRWKLMIIYWLRNGPLRFNQLQRDLGPITHRTLSKQLKEMEGDRLVERHDYGEIPPRVEYRLTPLGRSLEPILTSMEQWAQDHAGDLKRIARAHAAERAEDAAQDI